MKKKNKIRIKLMFPLNLRRKAHGKIDINNQSTNTPTTMTTAMPLYGHLIDLIKDIKL